MRLATLVGLGGVLLVPARSDGQLLELQPGAKVRVTAPALLGGVYEAVVGSRTADTLALVRSGSPTLQVPVSALSSASLSRGRSRSAGAKRGVLWGAGIGLAVGALAVATSEEFRTECYSSRSDIYVLNCGGPTRAQAVASVTLGGAIWGLGIGALVGRERWEALSVAPRVGAVLKGAPGGVRLGLRVGF
jgi:hypothetical protein